MLTILMLVTLSACASQNFDSCRPSNARRLLADTLSAGATEIVFQRKEQACEDERQATQKAVELCGRALQNTLDQCDEACKPRQEVSRSLAHCSELASKSNDGSAEKCKSLSDVLATKSDNVLTMALVATKGQCAEQTPACQMLAPCTWMSTGVGGDEYDQDACILSLRKDPVCGAALANAANTAERGRQNVDLAKDISFQVMMLRSASRSN